jgi:hypothetical protein
MSEQKYSCLSWSTSDIDLRLNAIECENKLTQEQKEQLLNDFFELEEDIIIEFINQRLETFLSNEI